MLVVNRCGPNEVLVVSGCCLRRIQYVVGGRVLTWPCCQKVQRISLNVMTLKLDSHHVYTHFGVAVSVTGIAQVKIQGQNEEMLAAACQQFLGKSSEQIQDIVKETLEGHQRAIMSRMKVEDIYQDRKKFSKSVFEVASSDLINMGISIVSYTIKDLSDDEGYLKALGMKRTAEVKRDARIGEAEARRDAGIKEAIADEQRMSAKYANEISIAMSQRNYELKAGAYNQEVSTKQAASDLAYTLQEQKTKQLIMEEKMQIAVIERSQQILLQEQEILRREKFNESTIKKPAEALKYKMETQARAQRLKVVSEAQGEAEAIKVRGEAEAFAIECKARAEAEQMAKKADAWKEYQQAAQVDMVLEALPKIAAEISAPLCAAKRVTMVSIGKGEVGAAKLAGEVLQVMQRMPEAVCAMTGVDISKSLAVAVNA